MPCRWRHRWHRIEPEAVKHFARDTESMLRFYDAPQALWSRLKTTNALERLILEFERKIKQVGAFPSARSLERSLYLVYEGLLRQAYAPFRRVYNFTRTS